jgi:hypothetical protein
MNVAQGSLKQQAAIQVVSEFEAMRLAVASHDGVDHGDSHASTDVAKQIVEPAGVSDLIFGQRAHGKRGEGDECEAGSDTA